MAEGKRYFWLKLKEDFFSSKRIKKLKSYDKGDTYIIIYLKMQLIAIKTEGVLTWTGIEDDFAEEIALDIDEDPEDVRFVLDFLCARSLAEKSDDQTLFLPYAVENTGSENASAQRVREYREKQKTLQCNATPLQCNADETQVKRVGNVEIEIEKEIETEKEIEKDIVCAELQAPPALTIILNDGSEYGFSKEYIDEMQSLYPAVDVMSEMTKMKAWCINNPQKRKTRRGVKAFVGNWLSREQDKGGVYRNKGSVGQTQTTFMDIYERRKRQNDNGGNGENLDFDSG